MHTVETRQITPSITLTCVKTDKFRTGSLSFNIITGLKQETAAKSALLTRVLRRGTENNPDMESLSAALDRLYGARVEPMIKKKGELHIIGFYADFPDSRFLPDSNDLAEKTFSLLGDILLSPVKQDGLLLPDYVESEKNNLIDDIRANLNDKRAYSIKCLLNKMCHNENFRFSRLGEEDEVLSITNETLTTHYQSILSGSRIEILYCGAAETERIESAIKKALYKMPEQTVTTVPKTKVILYPEISPPRRFSEELDVSQGKISIGFRLGKFMEGTPPDIPALHVFNAIYGSSATSKLFLNVREKLSLCYYVSTTIDKEKGIMVVTSGVDFSNFDAALNEILHQLENVKNGQIEEWELNAAKRAIISSIKAAMDRPGGLEELYFSSLVSSVKHDPYDLCDLIESVTIDRVVNVSSDISTDTIHILTNKT